MTDKEQERLERVKESIERARWSLDAQSDEAAAMKERGEIGAEALAYVDAVTAFQRAWVDIQAAMPLWIDRYGDATLAIDPTLVPKAQRLHTLLVDLADLMDGKHG